MNEEKIKQIESLLKKNIELEKEFELHEDTELIKDIGLDSLQYMKLLVAIEEFYDIEILDVDFEKISVVGELIKVIDRLIT